MGEVLWLIYEKSAMKFYIRDLYQILGETKRLKGKLEGTASSIENLCNSTLEMSKQLRDLEQTKEQKRVFFDYYRSKIPKLQKKIANTTDQKKKDRLEKNLQKQEEANKQYKKAC